MSDCCCGIFQVGLLYIRLTINVHVSSMFQLATFYQLITNAFYCYLCKRRLGPRPIFLSESRTFRL